MAEAALEPGRILAGKYRLGERLGEGGMGAVYRAEHLVLQAPVAIKVIEREIVADDATKARFAREAQAAAALRSPHVVQILDYGTEGDLPYMVMELLEGETLAQRIRRKRRLSANETSWVLSHVGRAVAKAHELGIVHRDLKPDNVFLVKNEDVEIAKVLDFGIAKVDSTVLSGGAGDGGTHTRTGSLLGTPYYMSPEQAQGNKAIDHRSDLWALGVIAFECLTGKRPFASDGLGDLVLQICIRDVPVPSQVAPVPLGFDAWFARATQRELEARFQSAKELTDALREALGIESRDAPSQPDVLVSTGPDSPEPGAAPRAVDAGATTVAENSLLRSSEFAISDATRRLQRVESKEPADTSTGDVPVKQDSGTSVPSLPPPRSGARVVVGVGVAALALGALAGVIALSGRPGFRVGDLSAPEAATAVHPAAALPNAAAKGTELAAPATSSKSEGSSKRSALEEKSVVNEAPPSAPAIPEAAAAVSAKPPEPSPAGSASTPETPQETAPATQVDGRGDKAQPSDSAKEPKPSEPQAGTQQDPAPSTPGPTPTLPEQLAPQKPSSDVVSPPADANVSPTNVSPTP